MRMPPLSPRSTTPYQMPAPSAISTSPISAALSAIHAVGCNLRREAAIGADDAHGNSGSCCRPVASSRPSMTFMSCIAWPDAPFTRLSSAEIEDGAAREPVLRQADEAEVRAADMMRRRHRALGQDMDESLVRVGLFEHAAQIGQRRAVGVADIDGREDAAIHRHQMRREADRDRPARGARQALLDLRHVAMAGDAIGADAFRHFGEQAGLLEARCPRR